MCGIAGIFDTNLSSMPKEKIGPIVKNMVNAIKHRGPDDDGVYCTHGVGLGASRLSIIDLSSQGHMPMLDEETGNCIVHNGEVYNYKELIEEMGLSNFKSQTDTEVVLKAYAKYGGDCLKYLNGMYAFSIWDAKNKRLFCVRDRIGIKPFFYALHNGVFYFASEIKSILRCGVPCIPNLKIIYDYLAYGVYDHSGETFFKNIKQIPPGHSLTVGSDSLCHLKKYWDISSDLEANANFTLPSSKRYDLIGERFMDLLTDSIRLRLRSDVPIALHASGGLDSTFMMATINRVNKGQGSLKAFSYFFRDARYDEKPYVQELTDKLGWKVNGYIRLSPQEIPELFREAIWHQEQPFPGILTLAKHKLIKESIPFGAKVILEGQGGDEIAGGYQYYMGPYIMDLIKQGQFKLALQEISTFGKQNNISTRKSFAKILAAIVAYYRLRRSADGTSFVKIHCLNRDFLNAEKHGISFPKPFKSNLLNMQYRDILYTKLPRILRSCDRASMAYGRELRVPFLDYRLVEFSFSLPGHAKIQGGTQRSFMRKSLKPFFSSEIIDMPKRAVVDPQREWLKGPLANWVRDIIFSDSFRSREIFNQKAVKKEYSDYCKRQFNQNSFHLWQWVSLELWYRKFIDSNVALSGGGI